MDGGIVESGTGTTLQIVSFGQDTLVRPGESEGLYKYLTGDGYNEGFVLVEGDEAVHDLHISDPEYLLESIAGMVKLL